MVNPTANVLFLSGFILYLFNKYVNCYGTKSLQTQRFTKHSYQCSIEALHVLCFQYVSHVSEAVWSPRFNLCQPESNFHPHHHLNFDTKLFAPMENTQITAVYVMSSTKEYASSMTNVHIE